MTVTADGTHWLPDVKTTGRSARPAAFARDAATFGYHVQDAFYQDGYFACTGVHPRFLDIVVETTAPHLVYAPGIVIFLTVLAFNLVGDGLRDTLDPKLK